MHAIPGEGNGPDLWLLGSSGYSAQVAGALGLPFAFAHHFMPQNTLPALDLYRKSFRPSAELEQPYSMIAAGVICADTDERAKFLAGASALSFLKLRTGRPGKVPTPEEAAAYPYSDLEKAFIADRQSTQHIGAPDTVIEGLTQPRQADRRRRADDHHPDPQPGRPPPLLRPGGGRRPRPLATLRPAAPPGPRHLLGVRLRAGSCPRAREVNCPGLCLRDPGSRTVP